MPRFTSSAGLSRSVCVAAAGVALAEGRPLAEALAAVVGSGPADVSPGLLVQLQQALAGQAAGSAPDAEPGAAADRDPKAGRGG